MADYDTPYNKTTNKKSVISYPYKHLILLIYVFRSTDYQYSFNNSNVCFLFAVVLDPRLGFSKKKSVIGEDIHGNSRRWGVEQNSFWIFQNLREKRGFPGGRGVQCLKSRLIVSGFRTSYLNCFFFF